MNMIVLSEKDRNRMISDAKEKVKRLGRNQMVRLYGGTHQQSYWIVNLRGKIYIGCMDNEVMPLAYHGVSATKIEINGGESVFTGQPLK